MISKNVELILTFWSKSKFPKKFCRNFKFKSKPFGRRSKRPVERQPWSSSTRRWRSPAYRWSSSRPDSGSEALRTLGSSSFECKGSRLLRARDEVPVESKSGSAERHLGVVGDEFDWNKQIRRPDRTGCRADRQIRSGRSRQDFIVAEQLANFSQVGQISACSQAVVLRILVSQFGSSSIQSDRFGQIALIVDLALRSPVFPGILFVFP